MSGGAGAETLYSAIEESARLVGAPCSRDKVWPVLTAFGGTFDNSMVVFSTLTGEHHGGQLDYCLTLPPEITDPYARALESGLLEKTDHPVGSLLSDIHQQDWAIHEHFTDCSAVSGFKKIYAHFPRDLQKVSRLAEIPSMPPSVRENLPLFDRYGMENVAMIGIDYRKPSVSLYFQFTAETRPTPENLRAMLKEVGLPDPSDEMLEFAHGSFRCNITLGWDSPKITRATFAPPPGPGKDIAAVPAPVEPHLQHFAKTAPRAYDGERWNLFAVKWLPSGEFVEVCSYYRISAAYEAFRLAVTPTEQP
jgi:hypothetical protein